MSYVVQLENSEDSSTETVCSTSESPVKLPTRSTRTHHRQKRPGTAAFVPYNILKSRRLVSLATRMKLTPAQQAAFTKAVIEESGGDSSQVSVSYATADRSRRKVDREIASTEQKSWIAPQ